MHKKNTWQHKYKLTIQLQHVSTNTTGQNKCNINTNANRQSKYKNYSCVEKNAISFCPKHSRVTPKLYTRGLGGKLLMFLSKKIRCCFKYHKLYNDNETVYCFSPYFFSSYKRLHHKELLATCSVEKIYGKQFSLRPGLHKLSRWLVAQVF